MNSDVKNAYHPYFTASPLKLVLLSVCTRGFYDIYWFYKNWQVIKLRDGKRISPTWRAALVPFWLYNLFSDIDAKAQEKDILQNVHPVVLTAVYLIFFLSTVIIAPWNLLSAFGCIPLLVMNNLARQTNKARDPAFKENGRFGFINCFAVFFGGLFFIGSVLGAFHDGPSLSKRIIESSPYKDKLSISSRFIQRP